MLTGELPQEAEALGLLALMLHVEARRPARRDGEGHYVPLSAQAVTLWRADRQAEAEQLLRAAQKLKQVGRFQLEAAIQSAHAVRAYTGAADWPAILALYDALAALTGSDVTRLNRAAALVHVAGPAAALDAVMAVAPALEAYQPLWALKANLLAALGRRCEAQAAFDRAMALTDDIALIAYLSAERDACSECVARQRLIAGAEATSDFNQGVG